MKFSGLSLHRSFGSKVAGVALITTLAALLAAFTLFLIEGWRTERDQLVRARGAVADVLAANVSPSLVFNDQLGARLRLESVRHSAGFRSAAVFDKEGRLFAQIGEPAYDVRRRKSGGTTPTWSYTAKGLEYRAPVIVDRERVGELALVSNLDELWTLLRNYLVVAGLSFTVATAVAIVTGLWLARIIIEPVSKLARAMDRVRKSGDFGDPVHKTCHDEVGQLTDSFNGLLAELKRNDRSLRETFTELTKARDMAQEANIQKSRFLANMSHEIRTPLNGVLGMAQAMRMEALPPRQSERLDVIQNSGEILLAVLNDILDISKIEAGKLELESVQFDLEALVESVEAIFVPTASAKGLYLKTSVAPSSRGAWIGDPTRLRQVLSNLVSNALKFTTQGGVTVHIEDAERGLRIFIRDTGIGIPQEKLGQLFDKFVQVDSSTTRRFGGTGLGLAICRELVVLMGGRIEVESVEGEGSCFIIDLPMARGAQGWAEAAESRPQPATIADRSARRLRVLAADDNATNRIVLQALLSPLAVELTLVENGREAVQTWREGGFDIILMDVQMPEMDGVQATRAIREAEASHGLAPMPIYALSANAMAHQIKEYLEAGMTGHVAKPIDVARLYEVLRAVSPIEKAA